MVKALHEAGHGLDAIRSHTGLTQGSIERALLMQGIEPVFREEIMTLYADRLLPHSIEAEEALLVPCS